MAHVGVILRQFESPCATPHDVAEAITFVDRDGLEHATRSGGHCFAGHSSTSGVLIDVGPLRSVSVSSGVATVGAGVRLGDVYEALDANGVTILCQPLPRRPMVRPRADTSQRSAGVRRPPAWPQRDQPWDGPLRPHPHQQPNLRHDALRQQRAAMVRATAIAPEPIANFGAVDVRRS
jgi:FAD binding domain